MASFSKQAAISIKSGLTLSRAFPLIARESRDRHLRKTLNAINADIAQGSTLSESLHRHAGKFPPVFVEMVEAGEKSGHLETVFARLSMAETIVYYTVAFFVCIGLIHYVFAKTSIGRAFRDRLFLVLPGFRSVTLKLCMARFARTLSMQLESAIPIAEAIERAAVVTGNGAVANNLKRMIGPIQQGENLATAMRKSRLVTPMIREVLALGEETGNFSESLERVAGIYEDESLIVLESIPKMIAPIVAILVGLVVLYLWYTVYYVHYLKPFLDSVGMGS
jgi:type II secretory pathway component PulF